MIFSGSKGTLAMVALMLTLTGCGGGGGSTASSSSGGGGPVAVIQPSSTVVPTVNAQLNMAVGSKVILNGSGSTDATGTISSYAWTINSRPAGSSATLSANSGVSVDFTPDVTGSYTLSLLVTDNAGLSSAESVTLVVGNAVPVVSVSESVQFTGPSTAMPAQNVAVGNVISLNASGSTDPNNAALTISWAMLQQPVGSTASLAINSDIAHFSPDVIGQYQVRARATNTNGLSSDVIYTFNASAVAPTAVVAASATPSSGQGFISAPTGYSVVLNAGSSLFPVGDSVTAAWTLQSKPAASAITQLSANSGTITSFVPDVVGAYVIQLSLNDTTNGSASLYTMTVNVTQAPVAVVTGSSAPVALASAPSFLGQAGVPMTLRGSGSYDLSGSPLTYAWSLTSRPAGSALVIANPALANITVTPDVNGAYVFSLVVTNADGATSTQSVTVYVGNYPPVAVVAQSQVSVLTGQAASDSAAASYSQTGNPLTYQWSVDAAPAGSAAAIANPTSATLNFTPDVAGIYSLSVTVSDGSVSSIAAVTLAAVTPTAGTMPLVYTPLRVKYSKSLDKAVIISANPNALHIVDPVGLTDVSVALPAAVKALGLSPNGQLAAVLHEGVVSLVDLTTGTLVHSSATGGSQTDVFLNNSGKLYLVGQTGGQWVTPGFTILNGYTGASLGTSNLGSVYGTTLGIYSDLNNKIFLLSQGLSPAQTYAVSMDASGNLTSSTGSPYWGNYSMSAPFWLSGDQGLLFTSSGTYFKTADLTYQGTFGITGSLLSMSHSATAQEATLLVGTSGGYGQPMTYPSAYKRYTGSLLFPAADVPLPTIGLLQSYGLNIFHASNDSHVMVVQTGSSSSNASGAQYFLIDR